jgi:hypothetical protein
MPSFDQAWHLMAPLARGASLPRVLVDKEFFSFLRLGDAARPSGITKEQYRKELPPIECRPMTEIQTKDTNPFIRKTAKLAAINELEAVEFEGEDEGYSGDSDDGDDYSACIGHTCNTTHCRSGWVVHLAGEAGYALERFHNTLLAAQLIYRESAPNLPVSPCRFFDSNSDALADMKRLADAEASV